MVSIRTTRQLSPRDNLMILSVRILTVALPRTLANGLARAGRGVNGRSRTSPCGVSSKITFEPGPTPRKSRTLFGTVIRPLDVSVSRIIAMPLSWMESDWVALIWH